MMPPNYRPSQCCETCRHGSDIITKGTWRCARHDGKQVQRWTLCDDWQQEGEE
jgi:hypothetical protein